MPGPRQLGVVIDCNDPDRLAGFWTQALGYERLEATVDPYVALLPTSGEGPTVLLQAVPEPKSTKNRVHVDVYCDDVEGEAERMVSLGARRRSPAPVEEHGVRWIVMEDPEGNEFCVCDGGG